MRFRISHVLLLMIFVAFFSFLLSSGSRFDLNVVRFLTWLGSGLLGVRAIVRPGRERLIILSGLLLGISYLACIRFVFAEGQFPTSLVLRYLCGASSTKSTVGVAEYAIAYCFGFMGAWTASCWIVPEKAPG